MSKIKSIKLSPRSPVCSDDEHDINVVLEEETMSPLKETVIEHKKINLSEQIINTTAEAAEEEAAEAAEEEEAAEAAEAAEEEAAEAAEAAEEEEEAAAEAAEEEEEATEEAAEATAEEEEAAEAEEEEGELDDNLKDFIVLCTHKYLYNQEIPSLTSNKRRQKSMERIISRHVDSICEAFKYLS